MSQNLPVITFLCILVWMYFVAFLRTVAQSTTTFLYVVISLNESPDYGRKSAHETLKIFRIKGCSL